MSSRFDGKVSVVMAVYKNDRPEWFTLAVESMLNQTVKADEFIVVVDGPVSKDLRDAIRSYAPRIKVIWLPKNKGLWNALNVGIAETSNELIARMDADDISASNRLELQIAEFSKDENLAVLGGQIAEFESSPDEIISYRRVPLDPVAIKRYAKTRSPLNHPTVMYKRSAVLNVGGYKELSRSEDYELWVRLLQNGAKIRNNSDVVLYYRVNSDTISRKLSKDQQREQVLLMRHFYELGFLSKMEYIRARGIRKFFQVLPVTLKRHIYTKTLREHV